MSTYLQRNPPRAWQMGPTVNGVRVTNSPTCVLHTYEADWSAAQGAKYISTRSNSAGYHHLTGLDQTIQLAPWNYATAHAIPVNVWAKGFSCMWFAGRWSQLSTANRRTLVHGMAKGVYDYSQWRVRNGMSAIIPRKISRAQAMRGENGIVYHGDLQADRTDPGNDFPLQMFLTELRRLQSGGTVSTPAAPSPLEGDIMSPREFWSYLNKKVDKRQVYRILRDTDANARDVQRRIRRTDWRTWIANGVNGFRSAPLASLSNRWSLREDGYRLRSWVQYAYLWARRAHDMAQQGRNEGREHHAENQAGIAALADQLDSLKPGLAKAVKDAMAEGREEQVRITAAEVAAELEAETQIGVKEDDDQEDES